MMKPTLKVFLILTLCIMVACDKKEPAPKPLPYIPAGTNITKDLSKVSFEELIEVLDGKWYFLYSSGGFAGNGIREHYGIYHIYGKDTFTVNDNGTVTKTPISWMKVKSLYSADSFFSKNQNGIGAFIRITNDTLLITDNVPDGEGHTFIKIK